MPVFQGHFPCRRCRFLCILAEFPQSLFAVLTKRRRVRPSLYSKMNRNEYVEGRSDKQIFLCGENNLAAVFCKNRQGISGNFLFLFILEYAILKNE
jgi:hypothetical protein